MKKRASSTFSSQNIFIDKTNQKSVNSKEFKSDNSKTNNNKNKNFKNNLPPPGKLI